MYYCISIHAHTITYEAHMLQVLCRNKHVNQLTIDTNFKLYLKSISILIKGLALDTLTCVC